MHDEGAFCAGLAALEFVGGYVLVEFEDFCDGDIEGFLGAVVGGTGVGHNFGLIAEGADGGGDGVAESAFFANFCEQSGAHATAEEANGGPGFVVLVMAVGDSIPCESDVSLCGFVWQVEGGPGQGSDLDGWELGSGPVGEGIFDGIAEWLEFEVTGDSEDSV